MKIQPTHEHVDAIVKFLRETLTEERTDLLIDKVKEKFNRFVPWFARPFVWRFVDRALPDAIIDPIESVLRSRVAEEVPQIDG